MFCHSADNADSRRIGSNSRPSAVKKDMNSPTVRVPSMIWKPPTTSTIANPMAAPKSITVLTDA